MKKTRFGAVIAAAVLTLTFAGTALASSFTWQGNGWPNEECDENSSLMHWIWTGDSPTSLTINGQVQSGSWEQGGQGGGAYHFYVDTNGTNYPPTSASIEYSGDSGVLTLSHCEGTVTTTTTDVVTTTTDVVTTTTDVVTTTTDVVTTTTDVVTTTTDVVTTTTDVVTTTTDVITTTTPDGSVEELTPPSTDTLAEPTSGSAVSTGLLLVLAGILAAAMVVVPAAARSRR